MNHELAILFLFILLFIVYFYFRKKPVREGLVDIFKKIKGEFNKLGEIPTTLEKLIKKELDQVIKKILDPINTNIKKALDFFKNLARLFTDWVKFISNNIMCIVKNLSNPICILWNFIRLIGLIIYGFVWLLILMFGGQSMANSFECNIIKVQDFLWKYHPKILDSCSKGCSTAIPIWGGKTLRSPVDKAKSKCKTKSSKNVVEENFILMRIFYLAVLIFFLIYEFLLPQLNKPSNDFLKKTEVSQPSIDFLKKTEVSQPSIDFPQKTGLTQPIDIK